MHQLDRTLATGEPESEDSAGSLTLPSWSISRNLSSARSSWAKSRSSAPVQTLALKVFPSAGQIVLWFPLLLLVFQGGLSRLLADGDTGWHIRVGDWILEHGKIPTVDIFSFTRPGHRWYAWEWAWDVVAATIHRFGGLQLLAACHLLLLGGFCWLVYSTASGKTSGRLLALVLLIPFVLATSIHWLARPHLLTLFLIPVCFRLCRWLGTRPNLKALAATMGLFVLWVNSHGGFIVGLTVVGAWAFNVAIRRWRPAPNAWLAEAGRSLKWPAGVLVVAGLSTLLNPYAWRLHQHIVSYLSTGFHYKNIAEFRPFDFQHPAGPFIEVFLLLAVLNLLGLLLRRRLGEALLILVWFHAALYSARNIPVLVVITLISASLQGRFWLRYLSWKRPGAPASVSVLKKLYALDRRFSLLDSRRRVPVLGMLFLLTVVALGAGEFPESRLLRADFPSEHFPVGFVENHRTEMLNHRVLTTDEWGDYLIYRLYPEGRVFVDGRSDFYGEEFCENYLKLVRAHWSWRHIAALYRLDAALLPPRLPLSTVLKETPDWELLYDDGKILWFKRRVSE